jgi:eukaryotic-like serine/threonine-protein kinase
MQARNIGKALLVAACFFAVLIASAVITMKAITWGGSVDVPDISGKDLSQAINLLKDAGLEIRVEREEHHPAVPNGSIISQSPGAGQSVKKGRTVAVVVSLGSEEVTVPDFTGEVLRRVLLEMRQSGLSLGEVVKVDSDEPVESVIMQDPPPQSVMQKGAKVDVLVSQGPRPQVFVMPELTGKTQAEADAVLKKVQSATSPAGTGKSITAQQIPAGYPVQAGTRVGVTLGAKPALPQPQAATPKKKS